MEAGAQSRPDLPARSADRPSAPSMRPEASGRGPGDFAWVVAGKVAQMGANALLMLLLAQSLDLLTFGLLVTVISGQLLLSRVLLLGVEVGIIRLHTVPEMSHRIGALQRAGLAVIRWTSSGSILLMLAAVWITHSFDIASWPMWAVSSVVVGAVGVALVDYCYSAYLAHLRYRAGSIMHGVVALLRLAVTALFALLVPQHPELAFLGYAGSSLIAGLAQTPMLMRGDGGKPDSALVRYLLRYSLWQGGTNVTVVLSLYQGTFLLDWLGQRVATGAFGLALTLSMGFFAIHLAFLEYLQPRAARLEGLDALPSFLIRTSGAALALSLGCVPVAMVIGSVIIDLLRPELRGIAPVFYCLSASMLLLLWQTPLMVVCQYLLRPHLVTVNQVLRVLCVAGLALPLAPARGAVGMAIAQLAGTTLAAIVLGVQVILAVRAAGKAETCPPRR